MGTRRGSIRTHHASGGPTASAVGSDLKRRFTRRELIEFGLCAVVLGTGAAASCPEADVTKRRKTTMKTIGVSGLGAQATVDFETRVHRMSQRLSTPRTPIGYPPMITWYHRRPPIVVKDDLSPVLPLRPDPQLLEAARRLGLHADFVVITANGPHKFAKEIESAAARPLLIMIDATIAEVQRRGCKKVGVLGFFDRQVPVYADPLRKRGLEPVIIDEARQSKLNDAVFRLMEGSETDDSRAAASDAIAALRARGVDGVI